MGNSYSYKGHHHLSPQELLFFVFVETAADHFGIEDVVAMGAVIAGQPILPTKGKFGGTTKGTSIASLVSRRLLPFDLGRKFLPTITTRSILQLRIFFVRNLGAFVGRTVPVVGTILLAFDAFKISSDSVISYNKIVRNEDRILGG